MSSIQDKFTEVEFSKQVEPPKNRRLRIIASRVNELHQSDIMFIWSSGGRYPYNYILVEIDVFSRYVKARALKKKNADEVLKAMKNIHQGFTPNRIETDSGTEFKNKKMEHYFNEEKIKFRFGSTGVHEQQRMVESFHRTLGTIIGKWTNQQQRNNKHTDWSIVLIID